MLNAREILADVYALSKVIDVCAYEDATDGRRKHILTLDNNWSGGNVRVMVAGGKAVHEDVINRLQKYGVC